MANNIHERRWGMVVQRGAAICALATWVTTGIGYAAQAQAGNAAKAMARDAAATSRKSNEKRPVARATVRPVESGLRDPFKTPKPIEATPPGTVVPPAILLVNSSLPPGSRGLNIEQLKLEGIVRIGKTNPKLIAVLANPANRAYFLHENDPLLNGMLTKITPDSVYFRENVQDSTGKTSTREVVKRLAPGEKK